MMYRDIILAALIILGLPLVVIPVRRLGRKLRKVTSERMKQAAAYNGRVAEVYSNIKAVKANLREDAEIRRTNDDLRSIERTVVRSVLLLEAVAPSVQFFMGVSIVGAVFYGGTQVIKETMSPGEFFSFLTALTLILAPVRRLASSNVKLQEGLAAAERIYSILDRKPELNETSITKSLILVDGSIRLEGICFNYSGGCGPKTLVDIDMEMEAGRTTAIVGPTGAGKSTILDLLLRFFEPSEGRIFIDDQDIRTVSISSLRSNVVLVSQEPAIFEGSVIDNIRYGTPLATEDDVRKVAISVGAHPFISKLAKGYNTKIGTRGTTLSGGQRQLITIARAMLRNPRILLLDEPTASLDSKSEEQVRSALRRLMGGRTVILVAHRLATVTEADRIYVLEGGKVIECGSHRELIQTGGLYSRLHKLQSGSVPMHGQSQSFS
jgi:subfamily B ATP-binding cassette protein MsbA